jgi:uncharacterized protein (TIGR02117 family)
MRREIGKGLKAAGYVAGSLAGLGALYVAADFVLSRIPVAKKQPAAPAEVPIFIWSNGVHTDIVLPIRHRQKDWSEELPFAHTLSGDPAMRYVGIGWGDKGFYLDTPTWAELRFSTAFRAMFFLSSSAMHTTYYADVQPGPDCVALQLSPAEYARLIRFIEASFRRDAAGRVQHIAGHSYGQHDAFYEAHRVYNLFYTCNTWANEALKAAGQKASWWTASDGGIFYQYGH